jgi:flagellar L-ring protein precursor FlgH
MKKIFVFTILFFPVFVSLSFSDSLYKNGIPSFFSDKRAYKVGDLITILIVESSSASQTAKTDTSNENKISGGPGKELLEFIPEWGLSQSSKFSGGGSTTRSGNIRAKITARITYVLPDGNFKIEGKQELLINRERQTIKISGVVRPEDISFNNTVLSTYIADAKIEYTGRGPIGKKEKGNIITKILDFIF